MEHTPDDTQILPQNPLYIQTTVALGKPLLKHLPRMDKVQMKLLFVMLEHIDWHRSIGSNIIIIDNQLVKARMGWNIKSDATVAMRVRDGFKTMIPESMITVQTDDGTEKKVPLIVDVYGNKAYTAVAVNPAFLRHMSNLPANKEYFRLDMEDLMSFRSQYSIYLYCELRRRQKYRQNIPDLTEVRFSTKQLKDIMGLDLESYTYKKRGNGHFDRPKLEKEVLIKSLEEINQSRMIELFQPLEGVGGKVHSWYRKTKYDGQVKYYYIRFRVREEMFDSIYSSYVNDARFDEIAQGFSPEQGKKKYLAWIDGIGRSLEQEKEGSIEMDSDDDTEGI